MRRSPSFLSSLVTAIALVAPAALAQPAPQPTPKAAAAAGDEKDDFATWLGNRFLQTSSPLVNERGIFEASFNHRFYQSVVDSGGSRLLGLDNGAAIFFSVDYAVVKNLAVQISRASQDADYEFAAKGTFLRPTRELPIGIGARAGVNWLTANYFKRQSSGFVQLLASATLADRVTLAIAPSYTQRTPTRTEVVNVPFAIQIKVTPSIYAMGEFVPKYGPPGRKAQWSFGLEKALYHHKFALWIGNSGATTVDQMLAGDYTGGVVDSNIRLGFNLMRQFDLAGGAP